MSAVNPLQPPASPGGEQRPTEPSMEEILASIRRIIADDQSLPGRGEPADPEMADGDEHVAAGEFHDGEPKRSTPVHHLHAISQASVAEDGDPHPAPDDATSTDEKALALAASMARGSIAAPQYASPRFPLDQGSQEVPLPVTRGHDGGAAEDEPRRNVFQSPEGEPKDLARDDAGARGDHAGGSPVDRGGTPLISATASDSVTSAFNVLAAARLADNSDELRAMVRDMLRPILAAWLDENLPGIVEGMVRAEIERVARGGH